MDHLWGSSTRIHSLDTLALRNSLYTIYKDTEGILEYINMLEDTQKQSRRADAANAFTNYELLIVANAAMLAMQQYEPTNLK